MILIIHPYLFSLSSAVYPTNCPYRTLITCAFRILLAQFVLYLFLHFQPNQRKVAACRQRGAYHIDYLPHYQSFLPKFQQHCHRDADQMLVLGYSVELAQELLFRLYLFLLFEFASFFLLQLFSVFLISLVLGFDVHGNFVLSSYLHLLLHLTTLLRKFYDLPPELALLLLLGLLTFSDTLCNLHSFGFSVFILTQALTVSQRYTVSR